jgi:hypothetical protein
MNVYHEGLDLLEKLQLFQTCCCVHNVANPLTECTSCRCIVLYLSLAQIECSRDTTAFLVRYGIQKCGKYLYELQEVHCLSMDLEDLLYQKYITYRTWKFNIPLRCVKCFHLVGISCQQKEKFDDLASPIGVFSLFIVTASVTFQLHSPST